MEFEIGTLLKAAEATARGNGRLLLDKCFSDYSGPTTLVLESNAVDSSSPSSFLIIRCNVPHATLRVAELPAEVRSVRLIQDHALLLPYQQECYEIYIAARPADAQAAYEAIREVITRHTGDWLPSDTFVSERTSAINVLSGGYGMLGKAPNPLACDLRDSLLALGCRPRACSELLPF